MLFKNKKSLLRCNVGSYFQCMCKLLNFPTE